MAMNGVEIGAENAAMARVMTVGVVISMAIDGA